MKKNHSQIVKVRNLSFLIFLTLFSIMAKGQGNYLSSYSSNTPTIDGIVNTSEWDDATFYNVTFTRNDGGDTKSATLFLQHDDTWLYAGVKTTINSGWDVYLQLRFDGNNDHLLSGNTSQPHTDVQIEHASPVGWNGYTGYYSIDGTNASLVTPPSGTEWESSNNSNVNYEYKVKLSDLATGSGKTIGFYMLNGTDGTSQHNYEFPINGTRENPSEWSHIVLLNNNLSQYIASYSSSAPTIDGIVNTSEWDDATFYNVTFTRNDGGDTKSATLFLQHDDTWLYAGVKTTINSGWDVYLQLRFDGNNDHLLSGNTSQPHTDVQIEHASPVGWNGYTGYYSIDGTNASLVTPPSGTEWESSNNSNVNYEYKVKLSDLATGSGKTIGFYMLNGTDGTSQHNYEFPINGTRENPSEWSHVYIDPSLNTETIYRTSQTIEVNPNPVSEMLFIKIQENKNVRITIFNSLGQQMYINELQNNYQSINMTGLIKGIYFIRINDENGKVLLLKKILKE